MFCLLCCTDCTNGHQNLFSGDGIPSDVCNTVTKYFKVELFLRDVHDDVMQSRVICSSCWQHIDDFEKFKQSVLDAHRRIQPQQSNFIALPTAATDSTGHCDDEMIMILKTEAVDTDHHLVNEASDGTVSSFDDHSSMDDMPLQLRWYRSKRSRCKNKSILDEVPQLVPMAEVKLNVAANNWTQEYCTTVDEFQRDPVEITPNHLKVRASRKSAETTKGNKRRIERPRKAVVIKLTKDKTKKKLPRAKEKSQPDKDAAPKIDSVEKIDYDAFIAEHWKNGLPCDMCDFKAITYSELKVHFRQDHAGLRGYVVCCGRKHHQRHELVQHMQVHLNPQTFQCPQCKKCSRTRRGLQTHIKRVHADTDRERKYECEVCHKRFAMPAILRSHMLLHVEVSKDYECEKCGKCFAADTKLKTHMRSVHNPENISVCEQCGKFFKDRYSFRTHMLHHDGVTSRKWPCDQCDAKLNSKYSMERHKRVLHNTNSVAYICSVCGKIALTTEALRSHKRNVHERPRNHVCSVCDKAFKSKLVLTEHMTIHTGENLYNCPHCPKTFRVSANMHHHRKRMHPKEWATTHQHRTFVSSADLSTIDKEIVM